MKAKLLIFGITGDLSTRKLLPAIEQIITSRVCQELEIIGVSRRDIDHSFLAGQLSDQKMAKYFSFFSMDMAREKDYKKLQAFVNLQSDEQLLVYLSVPPQAATRIVDFMGENGFARPNVKLLFEKPFGIDYVSAKDAIKRTARYFNEAQIYRIDHYLAKEMAQNIVAFRGSNALFSRLWDGRSINKIEVIAYEKLGIEGRAGFYEQTGALRDVVQGHLMQLLALVLSDIPGNFTWESLPDLRLAAISSLRLKDAKKVIRAQYESYQVEVNNPGSQTETFVSLELESTDPRWQNTSFVMMTGKALHKKTTEVRVYFQGSHDARSNILIFRIQPDEGVEIDLYAKKPGYERTFEKQKLSFSYPEDTALPEAYEQVLVDAINSEKSLFTSSSEVLKSWEILQPLLDYWGMEATELPHYKEGSHPETMTIGASR